MIKSKYTFVDTFKLLQALLQVFNRNLKFLPCSLHLEWVFHPMFDFLTQFGATVRRKLLVNLAVETVSELADEVVNDPHVELRYEPVH